MVRHITVERNPLEHLSMGTFTYINLFIVSMYSAIVKGGPVQQESH
jgi:hypothetical protein